VIVFAASGTPLEVRQQADVVRIREVFSKETVLEVPGRNPWVANLSPPWSGSSPLMFLPGAADQNAAELWNVEGKRLLRVENARLRQDLTEEGSRGDLLHEWLALSQDGSRLAWLSPDRKIHLWDLDTPQRHPRVLAWQPAAGEKRLRTRGDVLVLSFDGDSDRLAALEHMDEAEHRVRAITVWNACTGERVLCYSTGRYGRQDAAIRAAVLFVLSLGQRVADIRVHAFCCRHPAPAGVAVMGHADRQAVAPMEFP